ncbi:hypothetical protein [Actinomadura kijaniata]|uniref:hypothetical protein n=1 Tax=Actinomadura kijaniata TaxID=46161 RepID=UPI00082C4F38|nr:hypothetical protein [Actinomadura kijaniata]
MTAHHSAARTAAFTAWRDQADAATRHAHRLVTEMTTRAGAQPAVTTDPWLGEQLAALLLALLDGTAQMCPHLTVHAPAVVHAALWAPGRLVCGGCIPSLHPTPAEDRICDRCRHTPDAIHSAAFQAGPLVVVMGLCPPCIGQINATPARPSQPRRRADHRGDRR